MSENFSFEDNDNNLNFETQFNENNNIEESNENLSEINNLNIHNDNYFMIEKIKNDYEKLLNEKNENISNFINDLANENTNLKEEYFKLNKEKNEMENKILIYEKTYPIISENYFENNENEIKEKLKELENKYNEEKKNTENNFSEINNKYITNKEEISNEELETILNDYQKQILNIKEIKFNKEKSNIILSIQNDFYKKEKENIKIILINEKFKLLNLIRDIENKYEKEILNLKNTKNNIFESNSYFINKNKISEEIKKMNDLTFEKEQLLINNYCLNNKNKELSNLIEEINLEKERVNNSNNEIVNNYKIILKEKNILENKLNIRIKENQNLFNQINELRKENIEIKNKLNTNDFKTQINESNYKKEIEILKETNEIIKTELNNILNNKDNIINEITNKKNELEENNEKINNEYNLIKTEFDIIKAENIKLKSDLYSNNIKIKNIENMSLLLKEKNEKYEKENKDYINNYSKIENELKEYKEKNKNLEEENSKFKNENEINSKNLIELKSANEGLSKQLKLVNESLNPIQLKQTSQNQEKQFEEILTKVNHENSSLKNQLEEFYSQLEEKQNLINQIYSKYNLYENKTINFEKKNIQNEGIYLLKIIDYDMQNLVSDANSGKNLKDKLNEKENEINNLKNKISSLIKMKTSFLSNNYTSNIQNLSSISQIQLYEKVIKYIHYLNIIHELQEIKNSMKYENEIKNILNSNLNKEEIDKLNLNINNKLSDLNNNIDEIKKNIENDSVYFEQRLKNLINIEEIKKCINEIQKQYENIISNLFESFLTYNASDKDTENIILLLKIPVINYNNIIEDSMGKIENIVNYIKNWFEDINQEIGDKVDNAFEAVLNLTNVNFDDDYKNSNQNNFGY